MGVLTTGWAWLDGGWAGDLGIDVAVWGLGIATVCGDGYGMRRWVWRCGNGCV